MGTARWIGGQHSFLVYNAIYAIQADHVGMRRHVKDRLYYWLAYRLIKDVCQYKNMGEYIILLQQQSRVTLELTTVAYIVDADTVFKS